jgi:hypothetical protein
VSGAVTLDLDEDCAELAKVLGKRSPQGEIIDVLREAELKVSTRVTRQADKLLTWPQRDRHLQGKQPERRTLGGCWQWHPR